MDKNKPPGSNTKNSQKSKQETHKTSIKHIKYKNKEFSEMSA